LLDCISFVEILDPETPLALRLNISETNDATVSISPTFYEQLLRQIPFAKKLQTQIVST